jgi:DNA-directed RNA polymerase
MESYDTLASRREELRLRLIDAQKQWEVECYDLGARRYREAAAASTLDQLPAGTAILLQTVPPLAKAIAAAQEEALAGIAEGGKGRTPEWWWRIAHLSAEQLAVMTVRVILSAGGSGGGGFGRDRRVTTCATALADALKLQMEHDAWVAQQKEELKAARRAGLQPVDMLAALKSRVAKVDTRAWKRWSEKIRLVREEPWPIEAKLALGALLLDLAVQHTEGWFECLLQPVAGGKTERRIRLSDLALRAIDDLDQRAALAMPLHMPMIAPPRPWRRIPEPQKEAA